MLKGLRDSILFVKEGFVRLFTKSTIGVLTAFSVKVAGTALGLLFSILLARLLGPSGLGVYFLALTMIGIGSTVALFGLDNAALRFASVAYHEKKNDVLAALYRISMLFVVVVGVLTALVIWLILPWLPFGGERSGDFHSAMPIMLMALVPYAVIQLQGQFFKAISAPGVATFIQAAMLPMALMVGGCILFLLNSTSIQDVSLVYFLSTISVVLVAALMWHRRLPKLWKQSGDFDIKKLLRTSWPLLWVSSMALVMNWTDIIVLGIWTEPETVGLYGVAMRIAVLTSFILTAVNSVTAPRFAALYSSGNQKGLERLARRSATGMLVAVLPVAIFILALPEFILQIFGSEFTNASLVLRILVVGQLINIMVGSVGYLLVMTGHERVVRNNTVFSICINLIGNLVLVPEYGGVGAALSTALALIFQNFILYWKVRKILKINTLFFVP